VTQFITADGSETGLLSSIKRFYLQDNKVIPNSVSNIANVPAQNSIDDAYCAAQKSAFGDTNTFAAMGGLKTISDSMDRGQVLVLSICVDYKTDMLWLDGSTPAGRSGPA